MNAILSDKGQITIPKKLRDELGLLPGTVLDFLEEDGSVVMRKVMVKVPAARWRGKGRLPKGCSVDQYLALTRREL